MERGVNVFAHLVAKRVVEGKTQLSFGSNPDVIDGRERLRAWSRARRSLYFTVVPLVGVAIGWPLGMLWAFGIDVRPLLLVRPARLAGRQRRPGDADHLIFHQFFAMKTRQIQAENRATEAQLRLLQAQIEPHFLFNTLANVVSLMEADPPRARAMLESFVDYLRASLTGLGQATHTLGDEIDLVDAYLRIIKMRMEDRLQYTIDVPGELRARHAAGAAACSRWSRTRSSTASSRRSAAARSASRRGSSAARCC